MQVQLTFVVKGLREDFENGPQRAGADPPLKPPLAGLMRRIMGRQVRSWGAGPQDPQDAINYWTVLPPGPPSTVVAARQLAKKASDHVPLLVREVTGMTRIGVGHPNRMAPLWSSLPKLGSVNTTA